MAPVDVLSAVLLLSGSLLTLLAAIGLLRLPDALARLQAATKPQVLGFLLVLAGIAPQLSAAYLRLELVLVAVFQLATAPVLAQLVGRAAYRSGAARGDSLVTDELAGATEGRDDEGSS